MPPIPEWNGDIHGLFAGWLADASLPTHVAGFWERRDAPNPIFVHYDDLEADLDAEMRRIADFLGIRVPESLWPAAVERCTFESMRERGRGRPSIREPAGDPVGGPGV